MKTQKIKWDKSMAVRCMSRIKTGYVPVYVKVERNPTISFQTGEWDDFKTKLAKEIERLDD